MLPRKQRSPRFLPFKVGDRIVMCPHKTGAALRGRTGTIYSVYNHLEVVACMDSGVSPFKQTEKCESMNVKTYLLRHASECSDCYNRLTHMMGAYCPHEHKDIIFYEEQENQDECETDTGNSNPEVPRMPSCPS